MITAQKLEYFQLIQKLECDLSEWRLRQFMRGYQHGYHLQPPNVEKSNPFYKSGWFDGQRDRRVDLAQVPEEQVYWSESSVTGEY